MARPRYAFWIASLLALRCTPRITYGSSPDGVAEAASYGPQYVIATNAAIESAASAEPVTHEGRAERPIPAARRNLMRARPSTQSSGCPTRAEEQTETIRFGSATKRKAKTTLTGQQVTHSEQTNPCKSRGPRVECGKSEYRPLPRGGSSRPMVARLVRYGPVKTKDKLFVLIANHVLHCALTTRVTGLTHLVPFNRARGLLRRAHAWFGHTGALVHSCGVRTGSVLIVRRCRRCPWLHNARA